MSRLNPTCCQHDICDYHQSVAEDLAAERMAAASGIEADWAAGRYEREVLGR